MSRKKPFLSLIIFFILTLFVTMISAQTGDRRRGTIDNDTPFVEILFDVPRSGSLLTIEMNALSGDLDTLLYLVDRDGNILAENDDFARTTNSFIQFPQADAGRYLIIATRYGVVGGTSSGEYELIISITPQAEAVVFDYDVSDEALASVGYPQLEARPRADWTVLAFYGGDNNLEPSLEIDFKEFEVGGGTTDDVNVVLFFDRSSEFSSSNDNWVGARVFEVLDDATGEGVTRPPILNSPALADLGVVNSGDGQTLAQFLVWALKYYPADNYVITFGSHGAGWEGVSRADSFGQDLITLPELREALRLAQEQAGIDKFQLIINDACLMASIEYFDVVAEYFNYALASPEIVVDPAHDMSLLLNLIKDNLGAPVASYGTTLIDKYIDQDILLRPGSDTAFLTSTLIRLENYQRVGRTIEAFATVVKSNPALYSVLLGRARSNAYVYSGFLGDDALIDLGALMRQVIFLADPATNTALIETAQEVLEALQESVTYGRGGRQVTIQTNTYQNIYFPSSSQRFNPSYLEQTYLPGWGSMLRAYYNAVTPQVWSLGETVYRFHPPIVPKVSITSIYPTNELSNVNPLNITQQIVGRNIAFTNFTVDQIQPDGTIFRQLSQRILTPVFRNGEFQLVNEWNSGVDINEIVFDVTLPKVTDGENSFNELLNITENVSSLEGRYRVSETDVWNNVSLVFNIPPEGQPAQVQRVVNRSTDSSAVAVVEIPVGAEFQTFRYQVTPDGRVVTQIGNTYRWPQGGLQWSWQPAPSGNYNLGFLVTTFGGTTGFNTASVVINNDNTNPDLRSNIRGTLGFSWSRPKTWLPAVLLFADSGFSFLRSNSPDSSANLSFYVVRPNQGLTPDLTVIAEAAQRDYAMTRTSDYREITVDGQPALEFDYTYVKNGIEFVGRAFAYYIVNRVPPLGFVFAAEVGENSADDLEDVYSILRDELVLFEPIATDVSDWYLDYAIDGTEYPVLNDWDYEFDDEGVWAKHAPNGDVTSPTFMSIAQIFTASTDGQVVLDNLIDTYITPNVTNYTEIDRRDYAALRHTWRAVIYTVERDGLPISGRLYITFFNNRVYAMWMETPTQQDTDVTYAEIFEPMVDRMTIEVLEDDDTVVTSQPVTINAQSNDEPGLLLRYDGRSLLVYNRLPSATLDISNIRFVQTPLSGATLSFSTSEWEFGDKTRVGPYACYHVWNAGYVDLPLNEYPVEICRTRQAFRATRSPFWLNNDSGTRFQVYNGTQLLGTCDTVPPLTFNEYVNSPELNVKRTCIVDVTP